MVLEFYMIWCEFMVYSLSISVVKEFGRNGRELGSISLSVVVWKVVIIVRFYIVVGFGWSVEYYFKLVFGFWILGM